jgi:3-ketosteroid 9alpha-monooxygenase subunit A
MRPPTPDPGPRYPFPPFPAGWFALAYSEELPPGAVVPIEALGRELVLFRGEDGAARVFSAYCPHLGAHLGYGGRVVEGGIECPFHRWRFAADGACAAIPYSSKAIPQQARLEPWAVRERNGAVFVWHDPAGGAPRWEVPLVAEVGAPGWTPLASIDRVARFHCQEIRENGVDSAHFDAVHDFPAAAFAGRADGPVFHQTSVLDAQLGPRASTSAQLSVDYHGLGYGVARQHIGGIEVLVLSHVTPLDAERTRLRFALSLRRLPGVKDALALVAHMREAGARQGLSGLLARALAGRSLGVFVRGLRTGGERFGRGLREVPTPELPLELLTRAIAVPALAEVARQLDQDIAITERKRYLERPLYRDGEQTIRALRKWAEQFYPAPAVPLRSKLPLASAAGE